MLLRFLNLILVHNLLPTTHKTDMSDDMVHLVAGLMEGKALDVPAIMCYVMLPASSNKGSKQGLSYGVMINQLMEQCRVTFLCDAVVISQGLPIDNSTVHRMEGGLKRKATPWAAQVAGEVAQLTPAPILVPAPATVPPPTLKTISTPTPSPTLAPTSSLTIPLTLSAQI